MHASGPQPTTDAIQRQSLTTPLDKRYESSTVLSPASGNAKGAGAAGFARTDSVNAGDKDFQTGQGPAGIRNDTRSNILYTYGKHGDGDWLKTEKYAPSGRK